MTKTRLVTLATLAGLLLAGCGAPTTQSATTTTSSSSSPSSSPTSATSSAPPATTPPEEQATAKAEEVLRAYYRAQTDCLSNPAGSLPTCFDRVAIGTELLNMRNALLSAQQMHTKVIGDITVVSVSPTQIDLASKTNTTPPVIPTVNLKVCRDVSNFNVVDKDGKSIVPPERKPRGVDAVAVYNYKYPDASQWRVGYVAPESSTTC